MSLPRPAETASFFPQQVMPEVQLAATQRAPANIPPGAPLIPARSFPPQRQMDSAPEDGPVSVAARSRAEVIRIFQQRPCPNTKQYAQFQPAVQQFQESKLHSPGHANDMYGWVMAAEHGDGTDDALDAEYMDLQLDEFRRVFQCISGWILMMWRSEEDFKEGIFGARRAPRPLAWWDLRQAWDVRLDVREASWEDESGASKVTVMTSNGNMHFCVEFHEDLPLWYNAIRGLIKDNYLRSMQVRDTPLHQRKRWPAAVGLAEALAIGSPICERALCIAFHLYDLDCDLFLRAGELMLLIQELAAGSLASEGRAEGQDRTTALNSVHSRLPEEHLFESAMLLRRRLDTVGDGRVRKEDFVRAGPAALLEALGVGGPPSESEAFW